MPFHNRTQYSLSDADVSQLGHSSIDHQRQTVGNLDVGFAMRDKPFTLYNNSMPHPVFSTFCKRFDTAYWPKMPMTTPTNFN
jgi:hypothetical protein